MKGNLLPSTSVSGLLRPLNIGLQLAIPGVLGQQCFTIKSGNLPDHAFLKT
jgi:hypothetical protein